MKNVAVLFSGRGSNFKAILEKAERYPESITVVCAITDNAKAPGIEYAKEYSVPFTVMNDPKSVPRDEWERSITHILKRYEVDLVVFAGFMRVLHEEFCKEWNGQCINIHPSLLPKYPGLDTHKRVLKAGDEWHGCTIHYVTPEVDAGPIILQIAFRVTENDTEESLSKKVLKYENVFLPEVVLNLCNN